MAFGIKDSLAVVMPKEDFDNLWKIPGRWSSCSYDSDGVLYVFYENRSNNINCAVSYDDGINWFDQRDIIRLTPSESAKKPYVVQDLDKNYFYLFYVFNQNYIAMKTIDVSFFKNEDAYKNQEEIGIFNSQTASFAGLSRFSSFGKILRSKYSVVIDGDKNSKDSFWSEIENDAINKTRLSNGLSVRFLAGRELSGYNNNLNDSSFSAYLDANGVLRLWYIYNGNLYIKSSYDSVNWLSTLSDIMVNEVVDADSYDSDVFKGIYRWFSSYGKSKEIFLDSYYCKDGCTWNGVSGPSGEDPSQPNAHNDEWIDEGEDPDRKYPEDNGSYINQEIRNIDVIYSSKLDKTVLLLLFGDALYVRYMPNDALSLIDGLTENQKKSKGNSQGSIEYIVEHSFNLTSKSQNKLIYISGAFPVYDDPDKQGIYIPPSSASSAPRNAVLVSCKPSGSFTEDGLVKIFYYEKDNTSLELKNSEFSAEAKIQYALLRPTNLFPCIG